MTGTTVGSALGTAARALMYVTTLVPIVVFPGFFFPYVTVRAVFFRVLVELAFAIVLYQAVRREVAFNFRRDIVFWSLLAWIGANTLAAAFGAAPIRSLFGDHERMGGVWFWAHLLAGYVVLRTMFGSDDWWRFFRIAVGVAAIIAAFGLGQYWFPLLRVGIGGIEVGASIGNSGLLAVYLLANIAFCALLAVHGGMRARFGYIALALMLTLTMVFTGNRSSTLALVIGAGVAFLAHTIWRGSLRGWRVLVVVALFTMASALPLVTRAEWARPVSSRIPALSRLSSGVDSTRVIQWRAAVEGIRDRPLLGVGPENYQLIWSQFHHPEMNRFMRESRWDRAHNAYLDAFATAGILGFLSFLAVWIALGWSATHSARRSREVARSGAVKVGHSAEGGIEAIALGFFVAYAVYLFFWFVDLNSTMLWIALAAMVSSRATGVPLIEFGAAKGKRWQSTMVLGLGAIALVSVLYVHGYKTLEMARTLDRARDPARPFHQTLADFESIFASPAPVTQHAFVMYATHIRSLYPDFREIRGNPTRAALFERAFVLAIKEFERQAIQDPLNERILVQHARVLMLGAYYYGSPRLYESALAKLHRAVELSPRRVVSHLVLGSAYINANQPARALEVFQRAYEVYPPLGQTHSYLASAYSALGRNELAADWLVSASRNGFSPDAAVVRRTVTALVADQKPRAAAELLSAVLIGEYGPLFLWSALEEPTRAATADYETANLAADLFERAGDSVSARALEVASAGLCTRLLPLPLLAATSFWKSSTEFPDCRQPWRTPGSRLPLNNPR